MCDPTDMVRTSTRVYLREVRETKNRTNSDLYTKLERDLVRKISRNTSKGLLLLTPVSKF